MQAKSIPERGINNDALLRTSGWFNRSYGFSRCSTLGKVRILEGISASALQPGDIVIADNLRAHKGDGIAALCDLTPIEQMWSKINAYLRRVTARTVDALLSAIPLAFALISSTDTVGWFLSAGYS